MLRISLLLGALDVILGEIHARSEASQASSSCKNPPLCYLSDAYKADARSMFLPHPNYGRQQQSSLQQRSYYNGFNSHTLPAYYSAFDPISILASLAFLAFLLQSFASLFDRSRSILPTIISGRQQSDDDIPGISGHVSRALQEYENLNEDLERK